MRFQINTNAVVLILSSSEFQPPASRLILFFQEFKVERKLQASIITVFREFRRWLLGCYNTVRIDLLEDLDLYVFLGSINKSSVLCIAL